MSLLLAGAAMATPLSADPYRRGERIRIEGRVADRADEPIPGLEVVLRAFRVGFSLRHFREIVHDRQQWIATTDEDGRFALPWRWDPYFNRLELAARLPVEAGLDEAEWTMTTIDLDRRLLGETTVVVPLVVDDRWQAERARAWARASADQRELWHRVGPPERIGTDEVAGAEETSWWYFEVGRVYRFRDGELVETDDFEPVPPTAPQQN